MNGKRTLVAALLVTGMVLTGLAIAQAQQPEQQQEQQTQQVVVDTISGEIVSADAGVIVIRTTDGEMRFVMNNGTERPDLQQLTPGTQVTIWHTRDTQVATKVEFEEQSAVASDEGALEQTGEAVAEGGEAVAEGAEETGEWVADPLTEEEATREVERGAVADDGQDPYRDDPQRRGVRADREELPATASWNPSLRLLGLLSLAGGLGFGLALRWM